MLYPFVGWTRSVQLIFIFKWSKRPLDSGGGRCDHHHLYLSEQCFGTISKKYRHCSEQYQRNTDIIPKLFDIVPKVYFADFSSFSSYQKDNLISCAHFAHLIGKAMWAGSPRPPKKSMGQNGPLISIGTIPKKVVGIVPNIVPHIVPNKVPIALKSERNKRIFNFKYEIRTYRLTF